jgi:hypothetical protein
VDRDRARHAVLSSVAPDRLERLESSTFLPMQGQLNVAVTPHENLTVVMSRDQSRRQGLDARELCRLVHGLPHDLSPR